jgi:hypothetical protein
MVGCFEPGFRRCWLLAGGPVSCATTRTQLSWRVYRHLAGYEDVNDAERLSHDPTFPLIGSEAIWERGAALTSRVRSFETEVLTVVADRSCSPAAVDGEGSEKSLAGAASPRLACSGSAQRALLVPAREETEVESSNTGRAGAH